MHPERWRARDPEAETRTRRSRRLRRRRGRESVEAGAAASERAGAAERARRRERARKSRAEREIAARIAELHKTPPARAAAAPAPISSLIAARAGYAFKCYLIGLRRSWGPERPPAPAPHALHVCFPSHRLRHTPSQHIPPPTAPLESGLLLFSLPNRARGLSERHHEPPEDARKLRPHRTATDTQDTTAATTGKCLSGRLKNVETKRFHGPESTQTHVGYWRLMLQGNTPPSSPNSTCKVTPSNKGTRAGELSDPTGRHTAR